MDTNVLIIAVLAFIAIAGVGLMMFDDSNSETAVASKRAKELGSQTSKNVDPLSQRKNQTQDMLKSLREGEQQKKKTLVPRDIGSRLEQAGLDLAPSVFWMGSIGLGAMLAFVGFTFAPSSVTETPLGESARLLIAGALGFAGFLGIPRWILGFLTKGRLKKITNQFADALDVIVRGVKSGLPLNECLRIVSTESPEPLRGEFQQVTDGLAMGQSIPQALEKFYKRAPLSEVNFFAIVLSIQAKTGGNLSEALGNLSNVIRSRKMLREKVKALSAEAKASAMIIGSLPLIVMILVYVTTPSYIIELFINPVGHLILLMGAGLMATGIFVMQRMINFDM